MTKVECLKALISKMTGKDISQIEGDSICDLLPQITEAYQVGEGAGASGPSNVAVPTALDITFARKQIGTDGKFILGDKGTMDIDLILSDGTIIPANITFTDVTA